MMSNPILSASNNADHKPLFPESYGNPIHAGEGKTGICPEIAYVAIYGIFVNVAKIPVS